MCRASEKHCARSFILALSGEFSAGGQADKTRHSAARVSGCLAALIA